MKKPVGRRAARNGKSVSKRRHDGARGTTLSAAARAADSAVLTLPVHFDIRSVGAVAQALRERIAGATPVQIDATCVASTDTAGLQLLLAARRAAGAHALAFEWRGVSEALRATSVTIGLDEALGLSEAPGLS